MLFRSRDIVVTEYGIADLKGRSDRDTIVAMLAVTDRAFQPRLLVQAQRAGKLESGYIVPGIATQNHAARIEATLGPARREGVLPDFPLGCDMTEVEQSLVGPLSALKVASKPELLRLLLSGVTGRRANGPAERAAIERLGLASPTGLLAQATRFLVLGALRQKLKLET